MAVHCSGGRVDSQLHSVRRPAHLHHHRQSAGEGSSVGSQSDSYAGCQAIFTILLITILCIYVAVTFRYDLGPLPDYLGPNFFGYCGPARTHWRLNDLFMGLSVIFDGRYSSILTLPLSLMGASIFSEALWQRVWASQDHRTLQIGAGIGCTIVIIVVFLSGLFGFLAAWAGLIDSETNPNLYIFQVGADAVNLSSAPWMAR
eukprot:scaffold429113_cov50-Prasinocladus_malaysianus.AAC.1